MRVLYCVTSILEPVVEPPAGEGCMRHDDRLVYASKDDVAQQVVLKPTFIARRH
jgi:hypothetical protein